MRIVTYGAACSLDGFIAGADGAIDWLKFSKDVQEIIAAYWATVDTVLMGRKTWTDALARSGVGDGDDASKAMPAMAGITTYIFSRTLKSVSGTGVHLVSSDAGEFVRELKQQPGRGICMMGGGELAQSLFAADVIDEVGLNIHPVILGSGIPFFRDAGRRIPLTLTESRTIAGGCIHTLYRVGKSAASGKPRKQRKTSKAR
jgi:dihydrofolate reductase